MKKYLDKLFLFQRRNDFETEQGTGNERNWEYSGVHKTLEKVKQRKEKSTDADTVLKKTYDKEY